MFLVAANTRQALVGQKEWITTGSSGIQVQFLFSDDWDGLAKFAVFRNAEIEESVIPIALPASGLTELPAEIRLHSQGKGKVYGLLCIVAAQGVASGQIEIKVSALTAAYGIKKHHG